MASLSLRHIYKKYPGNVVAVKDVNLEIKDKEEQKVEIQDAHRYEIKEYLDLLDLPAYDRWSGRNFRR